jgi:hypothetical protein
MKTQTITIINIASLSLLDVEGALPQHKLILTTTSSGFKGAYTDIYISSLHHLYDNIYNVTSITRVVFTAVHGDPYLHNHSQVSKCKWSI